jgi:hypothetical protein
MIRNRIGGDFCEVAFGRDGHGHALKSKETLYNTRFNRGQDENLKSFLVSVIN